MDAELDRDSLSFSYGPSGIRVYSLPHLPAYEQKVKLSPKFRWRSEEFRAEFNGWLDQMFGRVGVTYMFTRPPG